MTMRRLWALTLAVILSVAMAAGCTSTATSMKNARAALDNAKAAGAEEKAPYEYYMAESYFGLAEHEVQEGDKKGVKEFAEKSEKFSADAVNKAGGGAK